MREEILSGLKSALEHGSSLDSAINSFIRAGYSETVVREAARSLSESSMPFISNVSSSSNLPSNNSLVNKPLKINSESSFAFQSAKTQQNLAPLPKSFTNENPPHSGTKILIIGLIIILTILLAGIVTVMLYGNKVISLLFS